MSLTYGDVLTAARDGSAWFSHDRIPGGVAARLASDVQRDLVAKLCKRDPEKLSTTTTLSIATITAALAVNGAAPLPVTLPAAASVVRMIARYGTVDNAHTLWAITPDEAVDATHEMSWYLQGGNAYFTGMASTWTAVTSVDVVYVPFVTDLAGETDVLTIPDDGKWAMSARLAYAFALRINGQPASLEQPDLSQVIQLDVSAFQGAATAAEQLWLAQASDQRRKMSRGTIRGDR